MNVICDTYTNKGSGPGEIMVQLEILIDLTERERLIETLTALDIGFSLDNHSCRQGAVSSVRVLTGVHNKVLCDDRRIYMLYHFDAHQNFINLEVQDRGPM